MRFETTVPRAALPRAVVLPIALALAAAAAACGPSEKTKKQIADLQAAAAQKDSLMSEVAADTRMMSEIAAEIARVQTTKPPAPGSEHVPVAVTRDSILVQIRGLTERLDSAEARLADTQDRLSSARGQTSTLRRTIADLQKTVANQKETIASLTEQVSSLQEQNTQLVSRNTDLTTQNAELSDTVSAISTRANTAYYVVGTKDDLLRRGLVEEKGGSRVLFIFGKRGQVLVPAADADPAYFTPIDIRQAMEIPLPDPEARYRIVSPQDVTALETPPDADGHVKGVLRIADPARFWAASHYLILVRS